MSRKCNNASDQQSIAIANQGMIVDLIREHKALTRAKLAQQLHLSPPSVSSNIERLIGKKILIECGEENSDTERPGRKGVLLKLNADYKMVLSVDLSSKSVRVGVGTIREEMIHTNQYEREKGEPIDRYIIRAVDLLLEEAKVEIQRIGVIVLCVPGIVDQQTSVVQYAPQMPELERLNLEEKLGEHYQKPILIKNDIKVRTLAEQRYGIGNKSDSFLHINIDVGVGAGVVIAGMLIEGSHFACGEIGYSILELSHLDEKHTSGHLENHVALPKFLDKIALELQCERETLTIRAVNKLYEEGNEFVVSQVDMLAKRIAFVIANATTLLDVSKVSIGGMVTELQVDLPARINKKLRYVMPYKPEVVFSELSNSALLMGACSVGTDYLLKEGVCQ